MWTQKISRSSKLTYTPTALASRLREHRAQRGLSQAQLARKLNCDASMVSQWERAKKAPCLAAFAALSQALRVDPARLLWGSDA